MKKIVFAPLDLCFAILHVIKRHKIINTVKLLVINGHFFVLEVNIFINKNNDSGSIPDKFNFETFLRGLIVSRRKNLPSTETRSYLY